MKHSFPETDRPTRSPWGPVQSGEKIASGIWMVHTAGHGGIKLSRERNRLMPSYMRSPGGWYEEDAHWSLTALVFAEEFRAKVNSNGRSWYDYALETSRNSYPDQYESFFGVVLTPDESHARARQAFERETHDRFVVASAWGDWAAFVPKGKVGVVARRRSDNADAWFLIDAEVYRQKQTHGFVIDPNRDLRIERPISPGQAKSAGAAGR